VTGILTLVKGSPHTDEMSDICSGNIQLYVTKIFCNEGYVGLGIMEDLNCHICH
jgi:hypothetical protein